MSTESKPKDITLIVILCAGVLLAGGICGFYYLSKNPATTTRATVAQINALETQVQALKHALEQLEKRQAESHAALQTALATAQKAAATAPPAPTTATDPALTAAIAALAESQKKQQATLAAIADKLNQPPALTATTPALAPPAAVAATPAAPIAPAPPAATRPAPIPSPSNRLELAYKQAWESGKPVIVGQLKNPQSGKMEGGRTLDPVIPQSLGVASWQEWYASEEKARRENFTEQAARELRLQEDKLVEVPK